MRPHWLSGTSKRGPSKVYQSGFRLLWGTGDFKGQIPVSVCIRHQDKVTTSIAAGPCCLFRWDGPESHQYIFIIENRRGRPRRRKGRKGKRQGMPRCWPPSREDPWQILSAWRTRHKKNAYSVNRRDIGSMSVQIMVNLLKQHDTSAINLNTGWHSALGTQEAQDQAPSLPSRWFNRTEAACSSQPTCHR